MEDNGYYGAKETRNDVTSFDPADVLPADVLAALYAGIELDIVGVAPRHIVDLLTSPSDEIGRIFKRGLRDMLAEREHLGAERARRSRDDGSAVSATRDRRRR